jgi:hypothetical protein
MASGNSHVQTKHAIVALLAARMAVVILDY